MSACTYRLSSIDPQRAQRYCYCDLSLMSLPTCHKEIKNNLILAHRAPTSHSLRICWQSFYLGRKITPCWKCPVLGGGQLKDQPLSSSCLESMPSFFHCPSDGIPSSVSCCLCRLLGNHWQLSIFLNFFFTGVTEEVVRLRGQHMGGMPHSVSFKQAF